MTADAGLASIQARFNADLGYDPNLTTGPEDPGPQDPMARLILALGRNAAALEGHDRMLIEMAHAIYPIPLPCMPYTVSGGLLKPGSGFAGSQHMGPRTGEYWDVTRLTVDGLAAGDSVTVFKRFGSPTQERMFTFTATAAEWFPGKAACLMRDGDALQLVGAALTATFVNMNGEAVRVAAPWIGKYLS